MSFELYVYKKQGLTSCETRQKKEKTFFLKLYFRNDDGNGNANVTSRYFYYFAIIPIDSPSTMLAKYQGTKLIGTAFK